MRIFSPATVRMFSRVRRLFGTLIFQIKRPDKDWARWAVFSGLSAELVVGYAVPVHVHDLAFSDFYRRSHVSMNGDATGYFPPLEYPYSVPVCYAYVAIATVIFVIAAWRTPAPRWPKLLAPLMALLALVPWLVVASFFASLTKGIA